MFKDLETFLTKVLPASSKLADKVDFSSLLTGAVVSDVECVKQALYILTNSMQRCKWFKTVRSHSRVKFNLTVRDP